MNRPILREIEALILTGKLKPRERLIEIELSSKLNASRFAVRKALQELTNHGLIETLPNKGARVIDLSEEEVEDIYLVRLDLEILASDLMVKRITSGELNRVKEIQKEYSEIGRIKNFEDMILKNEEFHDTLYSTTKNRFLQEIIKKVRNLTYFLRYSGYFIPGRLEVSIKDHNEMIQALEEKNSGKLKTIVEKSVLFSKNFYLSNRV